jgi:hypothetical protein
VKEAGDKLFTFTRFPKSQWKSIRTSNANERLHEEFKRLRGNCRDVVLGSAGFWPDHGAHGGRLANEKPSDQIIDSPHEAVISSRGRLCQTQFQHKSRRHPEQVLPLLELQAELPFAPYSTVANL